MQKITDKQFIEAMRTAVKEKGPDHRAPGTYWSSSGGAYCIVGYALWKIEQGLCPRVNAEMADTLLPAMGCSTRVAWSAYAAQHVNDMNASWADCLAAFEEGLKTWKGIESRGEFLTGIVDKYRRKQMMGYTNPFAKKLISSGGIIKQDGSTMKVTGMSVSLGAQCGDPGCSCHNAGLIASFAEMNQAIQTVTASFDTIIQSWSGTIVAGEPVALAQKDHALTA